jgi:hypothetical protein
MWRWYHHNVLLPLKTIIYNVWNQLDNILQDPEPDSDLYPEDDPEGEPEGEPSQDHQDPPCTTATTLRLRALVIHTIETKLNSLRRPGRMVGLPFRCLSRNRDFQVEYLEITRRSSETTLLPSYRVEVLYNISKGCRGIHSVDMVHVFTTASAAEMVDVLMNIVWSYELCLDCYSIYAPGEEDGCKTCLPQRLMAECRTTEGDSWPPSCGICMEPVYRTRLSCGHFIHRGCLRRMNPFDYFDEIIDRIVVLRCPLCRKTLDITDKIHVYNVSSRSVDRFVSR